MWTEVQPVDAKANDPLAGLVSAALTRGMSPRVRRAVTGYAVAAASYKVAKTWHDKIDGWRTHTVTVGARDDIYAAVHAWLLERIPSHKRKSLTARSKRLVGELVPESIGPSSSTSRRDDGELTLLYAGNRQKVMIDGHRVWVHVHRPEFSLEWLKEDNYARMSEHESIVFTASSPTGRDAVIAFLRQIARDHYRADAAPPVFLGSRWGDWRRRRDAPGRDLSTVVLRAMQKEAIVEDLGDFLARETAYARLGVPWHRGYLFEGPPGTGKTSLAEALSTHFGLAIYYLPLSDLESDNYLMQLVANIEPRSMLLLEDVDVVHAARKRDDQQEGVTSAGLLNAIDGVLSGHGVVTVMTTNNVELLDQALLRPGRVDRTEHVGYVDGEQLSRLVATFAGIDAEFPDVPDELTPAEVVKVFLRHLDDPQAALVELKETLCG